MRSREMELLSISNLNNFFLPFSIAYLKCQLQTHSCRFVILVLKTSSFSCQLLHRRHVSSAARPSESVAQIQLSRAAEASIAWLLF